MNDGAGQGNKEPDDRTVACAATSTAGQSIRAPRQARGRERRDAILDAAATIISEAGLDAVSMHAAARRAGASTGSIYHFFRDRDQLLAALADRHSHQLKETFETNFNRDDAEWAVLKVEEVVERLFGWAIRYFGSHPDALATLHLQDLARPDAFHELIERVMRIRLGEKAAATAAATIYSVATGSLLFARDLQVSDSGAVVAALPDVIAAYLHALEANRTPAKEQKASGSHRRRS